MGEEISSFDWLPAGWTVEAKVRRNGKRDKVGTLQPVLHHSVSIIIFPLSIWS